MLDISEEFQSLEKIASQPQQCIRSNGDNESRIEGYFCLDSAFSLSNKVLTQVEISVLEKGLDFDPKTI